MAIPPVVETLRESWIYRLMSAYAPQAKGPGSILDALVLGFGSIVIGQVSPQMQEVYAQQAWKGIPARLTPPESLILNKIRGNIGEAQYKEAMARWGFDSGQAEQYLESVRSYVPAADVVRLWRREGRDRDWLFSNLATYGFTTAQADRLERATRNYPGVADIILFAVREVFTPELLAKFVGPEPPPPVFLEESKKAGLPADYAQAYWDAHWRLPGVTQVYQMLHRLSPDMPEEYWNQFRGMGLERESIETDLTTMRQFLRMDDVMDYWRDRLVAISYSPYTRVDLRRLFDHGLISEAEVVTGYREIGYTQERAEVLATFAMSLSEGKDRDYTKSEILYGYRERLLSREEAIEALEGIRYLPAHIEYLLNVEDWKAYKSWLSERIDTLVGRYQLGDITIEQLGYELGKLDLPDAKVQSILTREHERVEKRRKMPTKADVLKWGADGLQNREQVGRWLERLGYSVEATDLYLIQVFGGEE